MIVSAGGYADVLTTGLFWFIIAVSLLFAVEGGSMELLAICALVFYKFKLLLCA